MKSWQEDFKKFLGSYENVAEAVVEGVTFKPEPYKPKAGEWFEWSVDEEDWYKDYCIGYHSDGETMYMQKGGYVRSHKYPIMRPVKSELEELAEILEQHVLEETGYKIKRVDRDRVAKMAQAVLDSGFTKKEK